MQRERENNELGVQKMAVYERQKKLIFYNYKGKILERAPEELIKKIK